MEKDWSSIVTFLEQQGEGFKELATQNAEYATGKIIIGIIISATFFVIALIVAITTYKYVVALLEDNEILNKRTGMPVSDNLHIIYVFTFIISVIILIITTVYLFALPVKLTDYMYTPEIRLLSDIFG